MENTNIKACTNVQLIQLRSKISQETQQKATALKQFIESNIIASALPSKRPSLIVKILKRKILEHEKEGGI